MTLFPVLTADKVLRGSEKLSGTEIASMTLIGLAVVFVALLVLVIFLYATGGIFKKQSGKPKKAAPQKAAAPKPASPKAAPAAPKKEASPAAAPAPAADTDDSEVIAVIMAAIAAMGAADGKKYRLRSVKQVTRGGSGRSVWAQAGISDATRPF